MALILNTELGSGVVGNYWKISSVLVSCTGDPIVSIYMELYLSLESRLSDKQALQTSVINMSLLDIDSTYSYDFRACLYNALKQLPEWALALDAIDEVTPEDPQPDPDPLP